MVSDVLFLSFFLIGLFLLLTFIAFYIDFLNRFLTRKKFGKSRQATIFRTFIKNISQEINSNFLSEIEATKIMSSCPVDAFTLVTSPKVHLFISDSKCLGYACLQCLQSLISNEDQFHNGPLNG